MNHIDLESGPALEPPPEEPIAYPLDPNAALEKKPFVIDEEALNLVESFMADEEEGVPALTEMGRTVCERFDEAYEKTEKYRARVARDWKLLAGELKPKIWPHKHAANVHIPLTSENICRIYFRADDELFKNRDTVFGVVPLGKHDKDAQILTTHGNWQLRTQIIDFGRQMSRGLLSLFFIGDVTFHSFYDERRKMNRHEMLTCDEWVVPYVHVSTFPDWSDVPFGVKILQMYRHDLQNMREIWYGVDELLDGDEPDHEDEPEQKLGDAAAQVQGKEKTEIKGAAPYKLLWYEGWMELPGQERDRFCQIVVDYKTEKVLALSIHERPNWQDVQRHDTQQRQLIEYRTQKEQYDLAAEQHRMMQEQAQMVVTSAMPMMGPEQSTAAQQGLETQLAVPPPQPPMAPDWMKNPGDPAEKPEPPRKEPIHLFSHGVCIEPLVGNLGLGFGRIISDHNRAANTSMSQFSDSATMGNVWGFIVADTIEVIGTKDGGIVCAPGVMNRVTGLLGSDIKESIIELKPAPANPQLMDMVRFFDEKASSSAQAPEALSGEPGKSGETYRGLSARIEQATKQLAVPTRHYANTLLVQVLKNNAYLNSLYLPDEEIFAVQDDKTEIWEQYSIGRKLYERNYNVEIRADLRFISQTQRIQEADELYAFANSTPEMAANIAFKYEAARRCLIARGQRDMIPLLGQAPPTPMTPFGMPFPPMVGQIPTQENKEKPPPPGGVPGTGGQPGEGAP